MPAWNWRRCIGMVLVQSRIYSRQSGDFRMRIPVLWFWKKKVMMINSSTGLVRCFILEREPAKMMRGRPGIGKSLQSWGISMLSMHLEHSGWKREVETAARQWNGLQKQQMQSTQPPSMCWGNYTRMVCILIKIWISHHARMDAHRVADCHHGNTGTADGTVGGSGHKA